MFRFPLTFKDENEDYVILQPLRDFSKTHGIKDVKSTSRKVFIANAIERFANESAQNKDLTNIWLDDMVKEGRKDIYIKSICLDNEIKNKLIDEAFLESKLRKWLPENNKRHIAENRYTNEYLLYKYEILREERGTRVVFHLCRMITFINSKKVRSGQYYPVICEILIEKNIMITRVKSKSKIYDYNPTDEQLVAVKPEREAFKASDRVLDLLEIKKQIDETINFKMKLYNMLLKFTETPEEIVKYMNNVQSRMNLISKEIRNICNVDDVYIDDISKDIYNLVEKYISISRKDKSIFVKNKIAYPIKMVATDEEDSVLQQASALEKPLQSKAIFFDNKKMLQKSEKCDGIIFSFQKISEDERYIARITANDANNCTIKLYDFVKEEDINEALFTLINS